MPPEELWQTFFAPELILEKLGLTETCCDVAEFGCGYGTFTIPAAKRILGSIYAIDIDPQMIEITQSKALRQGLGNVRCLLRDLLVHGSGLPDASVDYVMLFNILHAQERTDILEMAHRVLRAKGKLGIIHWNYDASTPRGPSLAIRPQPHDLMVDAEKAGFRLLDSGFVDLPPYHYGLVCQRNNS